jgi:hypothetical protein
MRFPTLLFAAVAGLWQHSLVSEEETITNTRHVHVTRFVTNLSSTAYAVRMGTLTLYMMYLPATLKTKSAPSQAVQTPHGPLLELRAEETSTMHIKVTRTVAQTQATIFASKFGTSVSTITNVSQSLIDEAAEDANEQPSAQLTEAIPSADTDVLTHSTVALLASTTLTSAAGSSALPSPTQPGSVQLSNSSTAPAPTQLTAASPSSPLPIGLELRSNAETSTDDQLQTTTTQVPSTVVVVIYGSSTSTMTSTPPTKSASSTSSQASTASVSSTSRQTSVSEHSTQTTQSAIAPVAVNTNAAQIKSIQTALIQVSTYSDTAVTTSSSASSSSTSSPTAQACGGTCSSLASISTVVSSSSPSSASSNNVYTIPVTMTDATSSVASTVVPSAAQTSDPATIVTSYGAQSSSSQAADIAADNAAGASGGDSSFKLSKGGFAAIISVVSVGVGLGSTSRLDIP